MAQRKVIGNRFEVGDLVGQGGMATVYRGIDTVTDEIVAIKLLKPEIIALAPDIVERFAREGEALRRLNHPSIVKVLATVKEEDEHYVIMEYVGGGDLRELLDAHRQDNEMLPLTRVVEVALDLSDALTRAHRLKIIHRDIKPANVLIAEDGTPRLTDFGVAQFADSTRMTQTGSLIGTVAYLSPEGCSGQAMDARADIWSFGVLLYEMLTLQRPFDEENTAALIYSILSREFEDLRLLRLDVPPVLAELVEQMLIKDREQRLSSVRLVGARLEAIMHGKAVPSAEDLTTTPTSIRRLDDLTDVEPGNASNPQTPLDLPYGERTAEDHSIESRTTSGDTASHQPATPAYRKGFFGGLAALGLAIILLAVFFVFSSREDTSGANAPRTNTAEIITLEPLAETGLHTVLVAQMEHVGGTERDVSRFIVADLAAKFESIPFSIIRIRQYPGVITSAEQAQAAAEANSAAVILWGYYDAERVNVEVQLGSLADFPDQPFTRQKLEALTNVSVQMTNERRESLASSVVAVLNVLHSAVSDVNSIGVNLATLNLAAPINPEVTGSSAAARWHRYMAFYFADPERALEEVTAAINIDSSHPVLYMARSLNQLQLKHNEAAVQDMRTAQRVGPEGWPLPVMNLAQAALFIENDPQQAITYYNTISSAIQDDWLSLTFRGTVYFTLGDMTAALADLDHALSLDPTANYPYLIGAVVALREGRVLDAQLLMNTAKARFPNPTFSALLLQAAYGLTSEDEPLTAGVTAFGHFALGQWNQVIEITQHALTMDADFRLDDLYLLRGLAHCNLRDYAAAEASYTLLIEVLPEYTLAYLMRAEVRQRQGDARGVLADFGQVRLSENFSNYAPLLMAFQQGGLNCENFLDADLTVLMQNE